jgi:parallel beta helix pectate lyase-like protein
LGELRHDPVGCGLLAALMLGGRRKSRRLTRRRRTAIAVAVTAVAVLVPAFAIAHVERASYWPDPAPDNSVSPPAGGAIPAVPNLFTALNSGQPGTTRVVCQTGHPGPTEAPTRGASQDPSHAEVDSLQAQLSAVHKRIKKAHGKKRRKLRRKARRLATQLTQAQQAYQAALTAAQAARQSGDQSFQQALADYQNSSMGRLDSAIADVRANGFKLRPSQPAIRPSDGELNQLRAFNVQLNSHCAYSSIQAAVTASGNNDRIVIMPGIYTEPASRAVPSFNGDATNAANPCKDLVETNDHGTSGAVSYKYQATCPNDQNLIAVIGRQPGATDPPQPPATDRHGIPDNGPCIRCNLKIQGSGPRPDDVIVEGADPSLGDHSPAGADQSHYPKDVGIRADRADGFVLDNVKVRHFNEHAVYVTETDGFNLDHLKTDYNGEYGVLTFVADHSVIQNCDAWGNGDSGIYPGASADLGDGSAPPTPVPPRPTRYGSEIRNCDMHHNALGYSGTDGNAVWVHDNEFYDNTQGFSTDVFTAPGHPGFPQDSDKIENNDFYSNNFNTYLPGCPAGVMPGPPAAGQSASSPGGNCSDVTPTVPVPVGTGMWIAGGNHNLIQNNHFWDNWKRGTMLFAVPDQLVCGPAGVDPSLLAGCNPAAAQPSTSYNNEFANNVMGKTPDGTSSPNGTDFWWDAFTGNTGNCWHNNGVYTSSPSPSPVAGTSVPGFLPEDCSNSTGVTNAANEQELLDCFAAISGGPNACDWFTTPPKP